MPDRSSDEVDLDPQVADTLSGGRHPRFLNVKRCRGLVVPGECFVVGMAGLEAAVEDADPAVGELAQCGLVADVPGAEGLVVGLAAGGAPHRAEGPLLQRVAESFVAGVAGHNDLLGPGGSGDGGRAGVGLAGLGVDIPAGVVAELAEDPGREDHTEAGQTGVELSVPVTTKMLGHHLAEGVDLLVQGADDRDLRGHDRGERRLHRWCLPQPRRRAGWLGSGRRPPPVRGAGPWPGRPRAGAWSAGRPCRDRGPDEATAGCLVRRVRRTPSTRPGRTRATPNAGAGFAGSGPKPGTGGSGRRA